MMKRMLIAVAVAGVALTGLAAPAAARDRDYYGYGRDYYQDGDRYRHDRYRDYRRHQWRKWYHRHRNDRRDWNRNGYSYRYDDGDRYRRDGYWRDRGGYYDGRYRDDRRYDGYWR